jgi:hypothetical protein
MIFENPEFDSETRTFRGSLDMNEVSKGECHSYDYELVFSEDFKSLVSGHIRMNGPGG